MSSAMAAIGTTRTTSLLRRAFQAISPSFSKTTIDFSFYGTIPATPFSSCPLFFTPISRNSALGMCHLAQAMKSEINDLLKNVGDKTVVEEVKHILDMARRGSSRREVLHTDFLTPPVLKESMLLLEKLADVKAVGQGGYPQAERCRLSVGHPETLVNEPDIVAALRYRDLKGKGWGHNIAGFHPSPLQELT